jgi:hypothetical protein
MSTKHFILPNCRPWWASGLGWAILIIGWDDSPLQLVNGPIYILYHAYSSR